MLNELTDRKILPRWRNFRTTVALGELSSPHDQVVAPQDSGFLAARIFDWEQNPTPFVASDLVSIAFVVGKPEMAAAAAQFIVDNPSACPDASVRLAKLILNPKSLSWAIPELEEENEEVLHRRIHKIKRRLQDESRNSILWVELSRLYTIAGAKKHAERAMRVACAISPSNRYVLRAAARLFAHNHHPETALRLIQQADTAGTDPWLMAAEIGVATVAQTPSRFAKKGVYLIDQNNHPEFSLSELASALGTLEMDSGSIKRAKKYFRASLAHPTENSVAQAGWASTSPVLFGLEVDINKYKVPRPFEAQATNTFLNAKWEESLKFCQRWLWDQPFSSRPAILASYIASGPLERYQESIDIITNSMKANPHDPVLLNNLAFALANIGKTAEAEQLLSQIGSDATSTTRDIAATATKGLIHFRNGLYAQGRELYLDAIEEAKKQKLPKYSAIAAAYLAREEILAEIEGNEAALKRAIEEARGQDSPDLLQLLEAVTRISVDRTTRKRES
jgi:tetratricopeptide (TPR) repeat protein